MPWLLEFRLFLSLGERAAAAATEVKGRKKEEEEATVLLLMFELLLIPLVQPLAMLPPVLLELTQMR